MGVMVLVDVGVTVDVMVGVKVEVDVGVNVGLGVGVKTRWCAHCFSVPGTGSPPNATLVHAMLLVASRYV